MLEVRLIGKFEIKCDGKLITIPSRIAQSLFAYLILDAGNQHRREKLAGKFWPDVSEKKARAYLRYALWHIRKTLSVVSNFDYLLTDDINISLNSSANYWLDVSQFKNAGDSASVDELMHALSVFQGELLPGFYDDWITEEREHLQTLYGQRIARLLDLLEKEQRWNDTLEWSQRWISLERSSEAAYRGLMVAYGGLGDRAKVAETYEKCVQALRELDLEPSEQTRTLAFKRTSKLNLPIPLTSFIGREKELDEVAGLLSKSRLVTLTGSGGVGKTRLAIQVVTDALQLFPDGVWFLDLARLSDPTLVPNALANLLGLQESGSTQLSITDLLINYFRSRTALVIFDNCEHLIESCAQLVTLLLTACEKLSVLATSREALRVSGEVPYRVPSLRTPMPEIEEAFDEIINLESVRLFKERAALISPTFTIDSQNVFTIGRICQRLDGIPLAIELATARVNVLNVEQILQRLDDRFNLLTGGMRSALPRQQTLRATIEWSYSFLSEKERILFSRLAVFTGGWTLDAAEQVCVWVNIESGEVLDLLSQLVNKSLVMAQASGNEPRYRRLESIRQYACEKLLEAGEQDYLRTQHLQYFVQLSEQAESALRGPKQIEWMSRLNVERDNIRSALDWAVKTDVEAGLFLAGRLLPFWEGFDVREGERWLSKFIENPESKSYPMARAKALLAQGWLLQWLDRLDLARGVAQECLELYRMSDDKPGEVEALAVLASTLDDLQIEVSALGSSTWTSSRHRAMELLNEALFLAQALGDRGQQGRLLGELGWVDDDKVGRKSHFKKAIVILREVGDLQLLGMHLNHLAHHELLSDDLESAQKWLREAVDINQQLNSQWLMEKNSAVHGHIELVKGNYREARAKFQESLSISETLGNRDSTLWNRTLLGQVALREGNVSEACKIFLETTYDFKQDQILIGVVFTLEGMAGFHIAMGKPERAACLIGWADAIRERIPDKRFFLEQKDVDKIISECISRIGGAACAAAYEKGKVMTLDEAIAYTFEGI